MTSVTSSASRPRRSRTNAFESDDYPSSTGSKQDSKNAVGLERELKGYTWQFDTDRLAKVFLPKKRKFLLKPDQVDSLDAYVYDTIITEKVLKDAVTSFGERPQFSDSGVESDHHEPLCKLLNNCVKACHKALGDSKGEYYRGLKFVKWDKPTQDGYSGEHCLKPGLAGGINLPEREEIKADGGLYWRRPGLNLNEHELLIPVEVKKGWKELVRQAGTYARCLFMASPLRKFALVLGYEYNTQEIRILVFHHGGLTSSQALKLNANGIKDLHHIFLAILSWKTVVDAGLPLWCNDSKMILPSEKGPQAVQVKKVLHNTLSLRGRCARVVLVCEVDESDKCNESKSNLTIPAPESIYASDRCGSPRLQSNPGLYLPSSCLEYVLTISYPASKVMKPTPKTATGAFLTALLRLHWCLSRHI